MNDEGANQPHVVNSVCVTEMAQQFISLLNLRTNYVARASNSTLARERVRVLECRRVTGRKYLIFLFQSRIWIDDNTCTLLKFSLNLDVVLNNHHFYKSLSVDDGDVHNAEM